MREGNKWEPISIVSQETHRRDARLLLTLNLFHRAAASWRRGHYSLRCERTSVPRTPPPPTIFLMLCHTLATLQPQRPHDGEDAASGDGLVTFGRGR